MAADKIGLRLEMLEGEFDIIPKEYRQFHQEYLSKAERYGKAIFRNTRDEYMPYIEVYCDKDTVSYIVQIDACPSKILFNHNLQELNSEEVEQMLDKLVEKLDYAGIYTTKEILKQKPLNKLDVNKIIFWPNKMDILPYFRKSAKQGHCKHAITYYPDQGRTVQNNLKRRKLHIYDKSKQSDDLIYLDKETLDFIQNATFTIFNVEFQMQGKKEVDAEFKTHKIALANTLENAFNPIITKTILLNRTRDFFKDIFITSDDYETIKEKVNTYCKKMGKRGLKQITSLMWICSLSRNPDIKGELLEISDRYTVKKQLDELYEINLTPVKSVEEFKESVINSIETNSIITLDYLKEQYKIIK